MQNPWSRSTAEVLEALEVDPVVGLDKGAVGERKQKYGDNSLRKFKRKSVWKIIIEQFANIIIGLLIVAGAASFIFGHITEGIAILIVILINSLIGFFMEYQAVRSMESLRELGNTTVNVRRENKVREIPAEDLVPGDIVLLEAGDIVSADLRILVQSKLQVNESALTGESLPVSKNVDAVAEDAVIADRRSMLYKGTSLTRGSAEAVVVETGMSTELGNISQLVEEAKDEQTPLEKRLATLGRKLVWVTLVISLIIFSAGYFSGQDLLLMIETAIALAVATVPEGLPVVATIALARGMWRMAHRQALVKSLSAVETLGATNIICTDKTGTLTENKLTVKEIHLADANFTFDGKKFESEENVDPGDSDALERFLIATVLCNSASFDAEGDSVGDPLEVALLAAAYQMGITKEQLEENYSKEIEDAFDPSTKKMAVVHHKDDHFIISAKGAPEVIIEECSSILSSGESHSMSQGNKDRWNKVNAEMAENGLRVIAVAGKKVDDLPEDLYEDLELYGLVGMYDPPREDVRPSVSACQKAGIRVVMVTGDQTITAKKIGLACGIIDHEEANILTGGELKKNQKSGENRREEILRTPLFARVNPEQKLDLIACYQEDGSVVAMTGDGVNDAPALKKADIGVAMGERGTQVAKEAADIVLLDDAFSSIVSAVREGRVIFGNIRKFVLYLLSCNISEILVIGIATMVAFLPLPILPLQILFLNLVTDVFPALALGVGEGDKSVMNRPPRKAGEDILTRKHWLAILAYGLIMTFAVLGALYIALFEYQYDERKAVTISFLTLAFAQLWHVFNMRDINSNIFLNEITRNPWIWGALILCITLLFGAVYTPGISTVMQLSDPGVEGWRLLLVMSLIPLILGQLAMIALKYVGVIQLRSE